MIVANSSLCNSRAIVALSICSLEKASLCKPTCGQREDGCRSELYPKLNGHSENKSCPQQSERWLVGRQIKSNCCPGLHVRLTERSTSVPTPPKLNSMQSRGRRLFNLHRRLISSLPLPNRFCFNTYIARHETHNTHTTTANPPGKPAAEQSYGYVVLVANPEEIQRIVLW